jgi:uncharacterized membrane protein YhaH (DUF805 family)
VLHDSSLSLAWLFAFEIKCVGMEEIVIIAARALKLWVMSDGVCIL